MILLIADDQPKMRDSIRRILQPLGAIIVEVGDGAAAVRAYCAHHPDWTILDIEMPVMDGMSAMSAIRRISPSARVLILTGHDSPALRGAARTAGAHGYALKSELHRLAELLRAHPTPLEGPSSKDTHL